MPGSISQLKDTAAAVAEVADWMEFSGYTEILISPLTFDHICTFTFKKRI